MGTAMKGAREIVNKLIEQLSQDADDQVARMHRTILMLESIRGVESSGVGIEADAQCSEEISSESTFTRLNAGFDEYKSKLAEKVNAEGYLTTYQLNEMAEAAIITIGIILNIKHKDLCLVDRDLIAGNVLRRALDMLLAERYGEHQHARNQR